MRCGTVSGKVRFPTRTVRGIVNLLSMDWNALNERIFKLRNLEIDQIIKVTITVLDDAIVSGEN